MFLDNEEHRIILLEMLSIANVPGKMIDTVYDLKKAIERAQVLPAASVTSITDGKPVEAA